MMHLLIATLLALSAAPEGSATAKWKACVDRTGTNADWGECGAQYIKEADAALDSEWEQLMAVTHGNTKADLIAEQEAWSAYRSAACRFYANGDWGREGQVLDHAGCVADVIQQRTSELASYRHFVSPE